MTRRYVLQAVLIFGGGFLGGTLANIIRSAESQLATRTKLVMADAVIAGDFSLSDRNDSVRITMTGSGNDKSPGPQIVVWNKNQTEAIKMGVDDDDGHSFITLCDSDGVQRAGLSVSLENGPVLTMTTSKGTLIAGINSGSGPTILTLDRNGKELWTTP
ncbi:MAG TPA: hypothetical protein VJZ71_21270 [Phycisphaerae bacterium]|nr:hypothetical protein [Phycisphaerae bacterium]